MAGWDSYCRFLQLQSLQLRGDVGHVTTEKMWAGKVSKAGVGIAWCGWLSSDNCTGRCLAAACRPVLACLNAGQVGQVAKPGAQPGLSSYSSILGCHIAHIAHSPLPVGLCHHADQLMGWAELQLPPNCCCATVPDCSDTVLP